MPLFRRKSSRQAPNEPYPDYDDTRWRYHLRTNAIETDHFCNQYLETINADRREAARLFKNNEETAARAHAQSALRDKRILTALAALSPLSNALYQRSEPLAGYTSLVQVPEPARSGVVTIVFAAAHLDLKYLSETVNFLRAQFSPVHIEQIQRGEGELADLINPSVREAVSNAPPQRPEVDAEIVSSVKEYFGISVPPPRPSSPSLPPPKSPHYPETHTRQDEVDTLPNAQATPLSIPSTETAGPLSPELTEQEYRKPLYERIIKTPSPPRGKSSKVNKMYSAATVPAPFSSPEGDTVPQNLTKTIDVATLQHQRPESSENVQSEATASRTIFVDASDRMPVDDPDQYDKHSFSSYDPDDEEVPEYILAFQDSDEMLLTRYEQLRSVISV